MRNDFCALAAFLLAFDAIAQTEHAKPASVTDTAREAGAAAAFIAFFRARSTMFVVERRSGLLEE
jgi:hypothetical protein